MPRFYIINQKIIYRNECLTGISRYIIDNVAVHVSQIPAVDRQHNDQGNRDQQQDQGVFNQALTVFFDHLKPPLCQPVYQSP